MPLSTVTIASACRDSADKVQAFRDRVEAVEWPRDRLRVCVCEGDSRDDTWERLGQWAMEDLEQIRIAKMDTGAPRYGHVVDKARFRQLARVFNRALSLVDLAWTGYVFFVPFDIEWSPDVIARLARHDEDMVSPLTFCDGRFFDTWALIQKDGSTWGNFTKAWAEQEFAGRLMEMQAIGGTVLMRVEVLRAGCRYTEDEVDRGLSRCARSHGFRTYVDAGCWVQHPEEELTPWVY